MGIHTNELKEKKKVTKNIAICKHVPAESYVGSYIIMESRFSVFFFGVWRPSN